MQKTLPKGWKWVKLGEVTNFIDYRGKTPKKSEFGIPLITAKNVKKGYISEEPKEYIDEVTYKEWMKRGLPKKGDVLFTTEAPLGNVAQIEVDNKIALAQRIITLQPNKKILSASFLKHTLLCIKVQKAIYVKATGSTASGIKASTLKQISILLPPLPTQHNIIEILEEADNLRKLRKQADEKMKDLIPSIFVQMFGDPATNPKGWEMKKLGEVCYLKGRIGWRGLTKKKYIEHGPIFLTGDNLKDFNVDFSKVIHISEERYIESPEIMLKNGDILMTKDGTIGKLAIVKNLTEKATIGSTLALIRPSDERLVSYYLLYFFASDHVQNRFKEKVLGCSIPHIFQKDLATIKIPLPPLPLQQEFAKLVEDIEAEKTRQSESRKKLDELFNSLMQRAFTGELVA